MYRRVHAALAAAMVASLVGGMTASAFAQTPNKEDPDVYFDLGIDASTLPQNAADAKAFFAKQPADTQRVLKASCDNYVKHPSDAEMPQTVKFCTFILTP